MIQLLLAFAPVATSASLTIWEKRTRWATIESSPGMPPPGVLADKMEIGTLPVLGPPGQPVSYYAYFITKGVGQPAAIKYADTFSCPALRLSVEALRTVSPSRIEPAGFNPQYAPIIDGGFVSFSSGALTFVEGNPSSELVEWYEMTVEALKPCWRDQPPSDGTLRAH